MLEPKDVVQLDNGIEYVVVSKLFHSDGKLYYYLIELNSDEVLFCYEDNGELVEVTDPDLNRELLERSMEQEISNMDTKQDN